MTMNSQAHNKLYMSELQQTMQSHCLQHIKRIPYILLSVRMSRLDTVRLQTTSNTSSILPYALPSTRRLSPARDSQGGIPGGTVTRKRWSDPRVHHTSHHLDFTQPWESNLPTPKLVHCTQM